MTCKMWSFTGTEVMYIHVELPPITDEKVNFQQTKIVRGSSLPVTMQLHGELNCSFFLCLHGFIPATDRCGYKKNR